MARVHEPGNTLSSLVHSEVAAISCHQNSALGAGDRVCMLAALVMEGNGHRAFAPAGEGAGGPRG